MVDPRGPIRTAIKIELRPDAALVTLSCGHVGNFARHFHYKIGGEHRCWSCAQVLAYDVVRQREADKVDGFDRDDLGLSSDY